METHPTVREAAWRRLGASLNYSIPTSNTFVADPALDRNEPKL
jgi:hypothetical protein